MWTELIFLEPADATVMHYDEELPLKIAESQEKHKPSRKNVPLTFQGFQPAITGGG